MNALGSGALARKGVFKCITRWERSQGKEKGKRVYKKEEEMI